jgi:hypothetical protein
MFKPDLNDSFLTFYSSEILSIYNQDCNDDIENI